MFQIKLTQTMDDSVYVSTVRADQSFYPLDLTDRAAFGICEFTVIESTKCSDIIQLYVVTMCLQFDALGGTSMKPRSKRAPHSKRLSIKDLALELAKKH
ncbi:hypothetical protein P5673_019695, partial [Acropora cervicornis]